MANDTCNSSVNNRSCNLTTLGYTCSLSSFGLPPASMVSIYGCCVTFSFFTMVLLLYCIITSDVLRRIGLNFFVVALSICDFALSLIGLFGYSVLYYDFRFLHVPSCRDSYTHNAKALVFFWGTSAYSMVGMVHQLYRKISMSHRDTVMERLHNAEDDRTIMCFLLHPQLILQLAVVVVLGVLMAYYFGDNSVIWNNNKKESAVLMLIALHSYLAVIPYITLIGYMVVIAYKLRQSIETAPVYLQPIIQERKRSARIVLILTVSYCVLMGPYLCVVPAYIAVLAEASVDNSGCYCDPQKVLIRFNTYATPYKISLVLALFNSNSNALLLLVSSAQCRAKVKKLFSTIYQSISLHLNNCYKHTTALRLCKSLQSSRTGNVHRSTTTPETQF